jgi:hypothetical protein
MSSSHVTYLWGYAKALSCLFREEHVDQFGATTTFQISLARDQRNSEPQYRTRIRSVPLDHTVIRTVIRIPPVSCIWYVQTKYFVKLDKLKYVSEIW